MKSPFKFLDSYQKEDRDIFFGRDKEIDQLYEKVFESNLILLHGLSGTGKSSLINCGLCNKFEDTDWFSIFIRRQNNLMESFEHQLRAHSLGEVPPNTPIPKILKSIFYDQYKPIYLIFDQFEELFILGKDEERKAFFTLLAEILSMNLQLTVLLSMREEYIAYLSDYEYIVPSLFENRFRLEKMRRHHIREVITGTLKAYDIPLIEPEETTEAIMYNLADPYGTIDLTSLQVYFDLMYRKKSQDGEKIVFDPQLVERVGTIGEAMKTFLIHRMVEVGQEIGNNQVPLTILYTLVTHEGTRRSADVNEILKTLPKKYHIDREMVELCLRRFEEMRILRSFV